MRAVRFGKMSVLWIVLLQLWCLLAGVADAKPMRDAKTAWLRRSQHREELSRSTKRAAEAPACVNDAASPLKAPKKNVWWGLTDQEVADVAKWCFDQKELNLTKAMDAGEWDNTILLIELMLPNKSQVLDYMDGGGFEPARYAHVWLDHRADENPYYQDILVGPLPVRSGSTAWEPLEYPYTRKTEGRVRNLDADADETLYNDWYYKIGAEMADITKDLWGATAMGLANDSLDIWGIDPLWQDDGIIRWDGFWHYATTNYDTETLSPLGLYFKSNVTGRDPSKWKVLGWLYNGEFYGTTAEFRKAYWSKGFQKLPPNIGADYGETDRVGPIMPRDTMYPPTLVAPTGARFALNAEERYVEWMDFSFYLAFNRDTGMSIYDIKYKGERIIYELTLQEALAHYAGNDPVQSGTSYLDSWYGFGTFSFQLVNGYDCPTYATYLNTSFYVVETTHTHINSICLFEMDAGYPMRRHTTGKYVEVAKNIFFTVRNVCTVGNYDYQFSYEFYMDGSIHVEVRASGYIQAAYWAHNGDYGYRIQEALSGSMHDHVLNYKIDFDVLGMENTLQTITNVAAKEVYPWSDGKARNTMKVQRKLVTSEDEGKMSWGANGATQFKVVNLDQRNKWGEYRGYRVLPSSGVIHLTVEDSSNLVKSANWAKHDLFVTKRKDTEPRSAHARNGQDVYNPIIDFDAFFDGENITQTDIVMWVNVGMHHVPHTGDLPNTVMTTAHSGLHIMPINYLERDPTSQTVNMVRIEYGYENGSEPRVDTFGQKSAACTLDFVPAEDNLTYYKGDLVIRKFPYNPNEWWYDTNAVI